MSYCRNYDENNQVYLYGDINGLICCYRCRLLRRIRVAGEWKNFFNGLTKKTIKYFYPGHDGNVWFSTRTSAILHLQHHKLLGHKFPKKVVIRLRNEIKKCGDELGILKEI